MGTRKVEQGEAGRAVIANMRRLRAQLGLSLQDVSDRLTALDRPILPSGLSKIEAGTRRVDVDDLVALAGALWTTPDDLLTVSATVTPATIDTRSVTATASVMLRVAAELTAAAVVITDRAGLTDAAHLSEDSDGER